MQWCRVAISFIFALAALCVFVPASYASEVFTSAGSKWPGSRVKAVVSKSLESSSGIQGDVPGAIERSFALWSSVVDITFAVGPSDLQSISPKGIRGDGVSLITIAQVPENLKLFPREHLSPTAVTRVFTDARGRITEADIVLNPFVRFSTDGSFGTYDLQEVLVHEIGHLLGLGHSDVFGSVMIDRSAKTMGPSDFAGPRGSLPSMDAAAIKGLYGPKTADVTCCGTISGKLGFAFKSAKIQVWAEDSETGKLIATGWAASGTFRIEGLPEGEYVVRAFAAYPDGRYSNFDTKATVSVFETTTSDVALSAPGAGIGIDLIGTPVQLGRLPLRFSNATPSIALGIKGSAEDVVRVGIAGADRWFSVMPLTPFSTAQSVKMIQMDSSALTGLSAGEYTVVLENSSGVTTFLPGSIVVR